MSNPASVASALAGAPASPVSGPVTVAPAAINAMAAHLRQAPPTQNPLFNPAMFRSLPRSSQAMVQAAAPQVVSSAPPATRPVTIDADTLDAIHGIEYGGTINPVTGILRVPQARLDVLGMAVAVLSNAITSVTIKWTPQRDFKAVRLVFPSGTPAGTYVQNIMVGNQPIYLGTANEPVENFSELSLAGLVDFPICRVGLTISATLVNTTLAAAANFYSCLIGYVMDGKQPEPLKGNMRRMAITPTAVAASASAVIALNPQDAFKVRKLALDQSIASSFIVTSLNVGNTPQLVSGDPIPAQAFSDRGQDVWVDWDRCKTGQEIFIGVTNISAAQANFQGALLGDIDAGAR